MNGHNTTRLSRHTLPAVFMRAGTVRETLSLQECQNEGLKCGFPTQSKGLFIKASDLPEDRELWHEILLGAMGSPDPVSFTLYLEARAVNDIPSSYRSLVDS